MEATDWDTSQNRNKRYASNLFDNLPKFHLKKPLIQQHASVYAEEKRLEFPQSHTPLGENTASPHSMLFGRLCDQQKKAVLASPNVPLCIIAGPGSGKTAMLTARIIRLLNENHKPILALTFTRKAADEIRHRVEIELKCMREVTSDGVIIGSNYPAPQICNFSEKDLHVGTIHSFCTLLLRSHGHFIGIPSSFSVAGDARENRIVKEVLKDALISGSITKNDVDQMNGQFLTAFEESRIFADTSSDEEENFHQSKNAYVSGRAKQMREWVKFFRGFIGSLKRKQSNLETCKRHKPNLYSFFCAYQEKLRLNNPILLDYNDLILDTIQMLETNKDARFLSQRDWPYIFCDEFQDIDDLQIRMLEVLRKENGMGGITVVGDDDQAIYGFRGSYAKVFDTFFRCFPNSEKMYLECNWRCTRSISDVSQKLIEHNAATRIPKNVFTLNGQGEKVTLSVQANPRNEAYYVIKRILQIKSQQNLRWNDFAILARTKAVLLEIQTYLTDSSIVSKIWNTFCLSEYSKTDTDASRFAEPASTLILPLSNTAKESRKDWLKSVEVLDVLAYCRLLLDQAHDGSFLRVYNRPTRSLGTAVLMELEALGASKTPAVYKSFPLEDVLNLSLNEEAYPFPPHLSHHKISYLQAANRLFESKRSTKSRISAQITALEDFVQLLQSLRQYASEEVSASSVLLEILRRTDYLSFLSKKYKKNKDKRSKKAEAKGLEDNEKQRTLHLETLLSAFDVEDALFQLKGKFDSLWSMIHYAKAYKPNSLQRTGLHCLLRFLKDIFQGLHTQAEKDCIALSTIHQAKGLEWPVVLLIRANEGTLPLFTNLDDEEKHTLDEERRLAYVAFTRACNRLLVSCALSDGHQQNLAPSRFLTECDLLKETKHDTVELPPQHKLTTCISSKDNLDVMLKDKDNVCPLENNAIVADLKEINILNNPNDALVKSSGFVSASLIAVEGTVVKQVAGFDASDFQSTVKKPISLFKRPRSIDCSIKSEVHDTYEKGASLLSSWQALEGEVTNVKQLNGDTQGHKSSVNHHIKHGITPFIHQSAPIESANSEKSHDYLFDSVDYFLNAINRNKEFI